MLLLFFAMSFFSCETNSEKAKNQVNNNVMCQDSSEVLKIAKDTLSTLYGRSQIQDQAPLNLNLVNDSIWVITGTQDTSILGGVAYIEIRKSDCKILKITHGK